MSDDVVTAQWWDCEAYGQAGTAMGVLCFVAGVVDRRRCSSLEVCRATMSVERRRMFDRLHQMAADGDPIAAVVADAFPTPDHLLGGPAEPADD